jgi:type II secretory pathway component PulM
LSGADVALKPSSFSTMHEWLGRLADASRLDPPRVEVRYECKAPPF